MTHPVRGTDPADSAPRAPDPAVLDEIIRRVVEAAQPDRIVLFGSAARGQMGPHSDVDLLVVKSGKYRRLDVARDIYRRLAEVDASVDVVVVTPADVERYRDSPALVVKPALEEGREVYAASAI